MYCITVALSFCAKLSVQRSSVTTSRTELSKVLFLALYVTFLVCLFVCESNISGTAELICAIFTSKMCFGPSLGRV